MGGDSERERWELRSGVGVRLLQFGMSPAEVAQALLVPGPQERVGGWLRTSDRVSHSSSKDSRDD